MRDTRAASRRDRGDQLVDLLEPAIGQELVAHGAYHIRRAGPAARPAVSLDMSSTRRDLEAALAAGFDERDRSEAGWRPHGLSPWDGGHPRGIDRRGDAEWRDTLA